MTRKQLILQAREVGLEVDDSTSRIVIRRRGRGAAVLWIYEDGSIYRVDGNVSLDTVKSMTVRDAAKVLFS